MHTIVYLQNINNKLHYARVELPCMQKTQTQGLKIPKKKTNII